MPKKNAPAKEQNEGNQKKQEAAAKATEAKVSKAEAQVFKATGNEPSKKLAPQAQGILNILKQAGKDGLTRVQLVEAMNGVITTKQPESRILSYYQKLLVDSGAVIVDDPAPAEAE